MARQHRIFWVLGACLASTGCLYTLDSVSGEDLQMPRDAALADVRDDDAVLDIDGATIDGVLVDAAAPDLTQADAATMGDAAVEAKPYFAAVSDIVTVESADSMVLAAPAGLTEGDFEIAVINVAEEDAERSVEVAAGWSQIIGFPLHNHHDSYDPYIVPACENHGMWVFTRFAAAGDPDLHTFGFDQASHARGVIVAYSNVNSSQPIAEIRAFKFWGDGGTNGLGMGSTSVENTLQVTVVATAWTEGAAYTNVTSGEQRFNSGITEHGFNVLGYDDEVVLGTFFAPSIRNKWAPSGATATFLWSFANLILTPAD